ncbi:indoleamine 2,3-dioxygenase-like protein [Halenospora varia]|nr:indoleamine 2,3-dioxygenase-like protein [Halenospora varia]
MRGSTELNLASFAVSTQNGFLPDEQPLEFLDDPYYANWEAIITELPSLLNSASLRNHVDALPVLSTSHLKSEPEWRRAYLILSFFTHSYIWEAGGPSEHLPPAISVPFLSVASNLGLPPTATYAALNLWNFTTTSSIQDFSNLDELHSLHTFTGTVDEEWFYLISVAIEAHGASIIPVMLSAISAIQTQPKSPSTSHIVLGALIKYSYCIREIGALLKRMNEKCNPDVFYNRIRPFLAGSKNMAVAGLPRGVFYDEGEESGEWRMYSGGSNAQSSLIQFFDIVLGVEHKSTTGTKGSKYGFLTEMRNYMPGPHRSFLQTMESISNIRSYASTSPIPEVLDAYNFAVKENEKFRDIHIQIVTRYIIRPSRAQTSAGKGAGGGLNLAVASTNGDTKSLQGTGGTELLPFLRGVRDEVRQTALE